jgi:energy-coupling factor transport system substrate-specific component
MALSHDEQPVDPLDPDKSYSAVLYNNTNGLPTSEANDIAETQDGFIWIGSYSGLIRYDGNTFERIDSTGGITSVVSLMVDSLERLWIGTNDNGLFMMEKGSFSYWGIEDGLRAEKICDIAEDDDGLIYIGTTNGVMTIGADGRMRHIRDRQIEDAYVETLKTGADGLIYGVTNKDDLFTLKDGRIYNYISHLDSKIGGVLYLSPDENSPGYIYIGTDTSSLFYAHISDNFNITSEWDISPLSNIADIQQIGRQIWICARNGIGIMTSEGFTMLGNLPMNNSVGHMMRDYEGNFWFTSSRQGVMKLVANRFVDIFEKYHLEDTVINSTCLLDGKLFMATDTGPIVIDENGPVDSIPLKSAKTAGGQDLQRDDLLDLLLNCRIRSIIRDRQDRLWISTWRSRGLVCYDHGQVTCYTEEDGMISDHIRAICQRDDGAILVALSGGVNVIENGEVTRAYRKNYGIQNEEILTVSYNPNGDILLGSNGDGIYVINDSGIRRLYRQEGLTSGIIMRIKYDPARQLYWIASGNALAYMTMD